MIDILLTTGTCGVGKSTTTLAWANLRKGVCLEVDELRCSIRDKEFRRSNNYQEDFMLELVKSNIKLYSKLNKAIAIDYVWTPRSLDALHHYSSSFGNVKSIWLKCESKENMNRDNLRPESRRMGARVAELRVELENYEWPDYLNHIDTTNLSLESVINKINELF
ncbi:MAG: hypothetical protein COA79_12965 [Planctomycetota bacterium]|nr:MAG: hypothetical protein COA79_12965 [Planctomycetota bacterium]